MSRAIRPALIATALLALAACKPAATPATDTAAAPSATPAREQAAATNPITAVAKAVLPSAKETVVVAMRKFTSASSFHATMDFSGGQHGPMSSELDFVAPDRFRMERPGMGTQVIIGDTMYLNMHGRSMKAPLPPGTLEQWRDPGKLAEAQANMTVDDQGSEAVDGQAARKYAVHATDPKPADTTIWIGDDGLPLQVAAHNALGDVTIRYSRINDPSIVIDAPK